MSAEAVRRARERLAAPGANLRCKDAVRILEKLGFRVRAGKKQGHMVVTHPGVQDFVGAGFTCGHGRNPEIRPVYVRQLATIIQNHEDALVAYLRTLQ